MFSIRSQKPGKLVKVFRAHCCGDEAFTLKTATPETRLSLAETRLLASGNQLVEKKLSFLLSNLPT